MPRKGPWDGWESDWGPSEGCGSHRGPWDDRPGLVAAGPLPAGACSEPFTVQELLKMLETRDSGGAPEVVRWVAGALQGGAALVAAARLARDHTAASGLLAGSGGLLWLRLSEAVDRGREILLWSEPALARAARLPALLPHNITVGPTYVCGACPAVFQWPHPLKAHILLQCGAPARGALIRRLAAAAGALSVPYWGPDPPLTQLPPESNSHRCAVCGKRYSRRYGLKIHLRTHSGYKPLRCAHCSRAFADPSNLNKHRRLHLRRAVTLPFPLELSKAAEAPGRTHNDTTPQTIVS